MKRLNLPVPACMLALVLAASFLAGCGSASALFDSIEKLFFPPGSLDESFGGGDGIVTTDLGTSWDEGYAVAVQSDGKIVLAGRNATGLVVLRYTSYGVLDATFGGGDGIVTTDVGAGTADHARAVAIQADGKIIVAGSTSDSSPSDIAVLRYTSSGVLDPSFSGDGIQITSPGTFDQGHALAIQSDGMIVVAGFSDADFVVLRYDDADGALDSGFGTAGVVRTNIGTTDYAKAVAIQPADQKIIAIGDSWNGSEYAFTAVRYLPNGTLDATFDTDGIAAANIIGVVDESANAVVIQTDGKIVLAGHSHTATQFALARLTASGAPDASFGDAGFAITAYENSSIGEDVALQSDGKIVLAGSTFDGVDERVAVARYLPDGSLDPSFGISAAGISALGITANDLFGKAIALQADGKILIAGHVATGNNIALLRVLP